MEVLKFFQNGKLRPVIRTVLPLEEAQEAHRILENREAFGKRGNLEPLKVFKY